ncbi:MAG TPA: hypothetical protein VF611_03185 [Pyrinomonadaceae bacterium]|jgi:hypothetical protein
MSKVIRASLFVLLLACSTQAGEMQHGSPQPPLPQPTPQVEEKEPTAEEDTPDDVTDTLIEAALSVLNTLLALL